MGCCDSRDKNENEKYTKLKEILLNKEKFEAHKKEVESILKGSLKKDETTFKKSEFDRVVNKINKETGLPDVKPVQIDEILKAEYPIDKTSLTVTEVCGTYERLLNKLKDAREEELKQEAEKVQLARVQDEKSKAKQE